MKNPAIADNPRMLVSLGAGAHMACTHGPVAMLTALKKSKELRELQKNIN